MLSAPSMVGQVVTTNPAALVQGPKLHGEEGKDADPDAGWAGSSHKPNLRLPWLLDESLCSH